MNVREKIEQSGTDHRWEFDRKRLFEQSNYMARICENLSEVSFIMCIIDIQLYFLAIIIFNQAIIIYRRFDLHEELTSIQLLISKVLHDGLYIT
jgi:hypothetical protein